MPYILWDGKELSKELFTNICEGQVIVQYNVTPDEVEWQDLSRLRVMAGSIMEIGAAARQCLLLCFSGYDFDPRALDEIPGVVRYIKQVIEEIPYIWYFLIPEFNVHIFECSVPHTVITSPFSPKIHISDAIPPTSQRLVQLDLAAADERLKRITKDVTQFGEMVGDELGARKVLSKWRSALNL